MSHIQKDEVKLTAEAARLAVTDEQADKFTEQLNDMLALAKQLDEVDTTNVQPTVHVINMNNVMREEDKPSEGLAIEDIIRNAPDHQDGQIRVPLILE